MVDFNLLSRCSAAALAGLCANPHHQQGEHPTTGATVVADRALALGKALAAKLEAERAAGRVDPSVQAEAVAPVAPSGASGGGGGASARRR